MSDINSERQRIAAIMQLPYPERFERIMEILARGWSSGYWARAREERDGESAEDNPYKFKPRRAVVEDVPGNE